MNAGVDGLMPFKDLQRFAHHRLSFSYGYSIGLNLALERGIKVIR